MIGLIYTNKRLLILLLGLWPMASVAQAFDHGHSRWTNVLQKYVTVEGAKSRVNYARLKTDQNELNFYLKELESVTLENFRTFDKGERLAFLINAYNALTVKLILDNYPIKSIRKIGSLFSSAWKIQFFTLFGEKLYLDNIEQGLIRQTTEAIRELPPVVRSALVPFNEPRIHFALNCASKSCPMLQPQAFIPAKLN